MWHPDNNLCLKCLRSADTQQRRCLHHSSMASSITRCGIADHASALAVVYLPKADTSNTSYDTYVGIVNLNGFVQPIRFYH